MVVFLGEMWGGLGVRCATLLWESRTSTLTEEGVRRCRTPLKHVEHLFSQFTLTRQHFFLGPFDSSPTFLVICGGLFGRKYEEVEGLGVRFCCRSRARIGLWKEADNFVSISFEF